ncbi:MAG: nucleotidyltransferase domain-containing protein [Candidatus Woesearchaeota archaeon]
MKTELKIIRFFIGDKEPRTIREISKKIKADYRITYLAVQKLIDKKIILHKKVGTSLLCELNEEYYGFEIYQAEDERRKELFRNKNIQQISKEIASKAGTSMFILVLFGSYAKGRQSQSSDIDLIFISNEGGFENKIQTLLSLLPLKIHALFFTEEEFIRMKDAKKSNVIKEAIDNHIILYNIESYYHLKNA